MNAHDFAKVVRLGMTATAWRGWQDHPRVTGRIVALTVPRYGAWIKDAQGVCHYFDSVWIDLKDSGSAS